MSISRVKIVRGLSFEFSLGSELVDGVELALDQDAMPVVNCPGYGYRSRVVAVGSPPVALQRDTAGGGLGDDGDVLLAVHEALLLRQVERLQRHVGLRPRLVQDLPVFRLHHAPFATCHLSANEFCK